MDPQAADAEGRVRRVKEWYLHNLADPIALPHVQSHANADRRQKGCIARGERQRSVDRMFSGSAP